MRFLTIDTDKRNGIDLKKIGDTWWITCGKGDMAVGVEASPFVSVGLDQSDKLKRFYSGIINCRDNDETPVLLPDPDKEEPVWLYGPTRRRRPKEPVLLLVNTPSGSRLTQAAYDEEVIGGEVIHQYHPFDAEVAPPGVQVWATSGDQWLLELAPNAAFRIEYQGMAIAVRWTGIPDRIETKNGATTIRINDGLLIRPFGTAHDRTQHRSSTGQ